MNPFVFACIAPHGGEVIPELQGPDPGRMAVTRESMFKLGRYMTEAKPDCIIVLTPHGTRINGRFSIADSERMQGCWEDNGAAFMMEKRVQRDLARLINEEVLNDGLPSSTINFGTAEGPISCLPLDWGAIVPLRFMPDVPIVVITPSRELSFQQHIDFGVSLREAGAKSGQRVGLIASCDWSHAHGDNGPYGFHPDAGKLDQQVAGLITSNRLESMMEFDAEYIENAKPDGIWQTLILAGAIFPEERNVEFLSYEAPTYFGMICAAYHS
ncbi:extradiol ring-cleavage dioxygenase [Mesobacillus subterraneus]|uniref:Extradiol ring-cleavage dioxygenase n=1 Tax=Mesobacillus subterraneus TaxID=285983 RepID=A0A3R9EEQ5_9BACI|nr:extradiol ring-cleavage dioxygenase [Mesobacillus subterraneus]RSD28722.1 extradiol ring-cleavage dioxygenase [Mesobacillus subterraneus]